MSETYDPEDPYWTHPGDTHHPSEFGYDIRTEEGAKAWAVVTGEVPVVYVPLPEDNNAGLRGVTKQGSFEDRV